MEWSLRVRGCRFKSQVVLCSGTLEKTRELLQENIQLYKWTLHLKKRKKKKEAEFAAVGERVRHKCRNVATISPPCVQTRTPLVLIVAYGNRFTQQNITQ